MFKAVKDGKISLQRAVALLSSNPARIFGLKGKGRIAVGYDADFVLLDPYKEFNLSADKMHTKAKDICHFLDGTTVSGKAEKVFLRGSLILDGEHLLGKAGNGRWIH